MATTLPPRPNQTLFNSADADFDLESYNQYRPVYTKNFYQLIFDFHISHGGKWDTAHDVGAGGGNVTIELGQHFKIVLVSDPDKNYIDAAKVRLLQPSQDRKSTQYQFANKRAEDMATWVPAGSVDMVIFGESIHWTNHASAIHAAMETLKPKGTLAIWLYHRDPYFAELPEANRVLSKIYKAAASRLPKVPAMEQAKLITNSALETIDLSNQHFHDVRRLQWYRHVHNFMPISTFLADMKWESAVGQNGRIEIMDGNDDSWTAVADTAWFRGYMTIFHPGVVLGEQEQRLYSDLEKVLDGSMAHVLWSATLLLASKI